VPATFVLTLTVMLVLSVDPALRLVIEPAKVGVWPLVEVYVPKLLSRPSEKLPAGAVLVTVSASVSVPPPSPTWNTKLTGAIAFDDARL
jgi:hypothetical protein